MLPAPGAASVRLELIEFVWSGAAGIQPVLYLERHYLD